MAKLLSGTRIYGTANVDTSIGVGGNVVVNTSVLTIGNSSVNVVVNSSAVYVSGSPLGGATNTAAQYTWTNTQSFSAVVTHTANVSVNGAIIANGGAGTSGQVLTSSAGGNVYWSTVSGGGGFTNGQSISVSNLAITGSLTAANSVGTSGQALISTGTGVQWGALSPGYNYSSQFNGSTQYLSTAYNAGYDFGTGDFTIEAWVYLTSLTGGGGGSTNASDVIAAFPAAGAPVTGWRFNISNTGYIGFDSFASSVEQYYNTTSNQLSINTWYHIAASRQSGTTRFFVNGILAGTTSALVTTNSGSYGAKIGALVWNSALYNYLNGFISNVRVVKGTAVYTAAFSAPTSPLSAISGTVLLTCNAITPTSDSSTNNLQITNTNGVTTTATLSPFASTTVSVPTAPLTSVNQQFSGDGTTTTFSVAGGYTPNAIAVYYNGLKLRNGTDVTVTSGSSIVFAVAPQSGALIDVVATVPTTYSSITPIAYSTSFSGTQYLTTPANTAQSFGTGDFTIEMWVYPTQAPLSTPIASTNQMLYGYRSGTDTALQFYWNITQGLSVGGDTNNFILSNRQLTLNAWQHIAVVRSGTTMTMYLNGTSIGTATNSTNFSDASLRYIGGMNGTNLYPFYGYLSNVRVVKGLAVYSGAFTPPQTPLTAVQSATTPSIQAITGTQTSLLTCNGPTIIDGSTNAFTITNNGSALVSTAVFPTFTTSTITSGSGSGGLSLATIQTANFTASAGYIYPVNTTGGAITVTLPASPTAGQQISITDYAGTFGTYNCILNPNGNKITGVSANAVLAVPREGTSIVYVDSTQGWLGYGNFISNPVGPYTVTYLIVGGGGGGGSYAAGGGGAGGLLAGSTIITQGTTYSFVVGAGGAGGVGITVAGTSGTNSTAFGITTIGGGGGGAKSVNGLNGGSGGGAGPASTPSSPGSGTSGQGYGGGAGYDGVSSFSTGGGGGGAGAIGGNSGTSTANTSGGNGGNGLTSSITGSSVYYAGGGGGGTDRGAAAFTGTGGTGGTGGGGNGGTYTTTAATAGTANFGGGGGGGGWSATPPYNTGGAGGSGVVILSIPTGNYTGIKTGSPTVTTNGTYTILTFTASGSYTA